MSADNWDICPRCVHEANKAAQAEHDRVRESYGKVPPEQYEAERAALPQLPVSPEDHRTLREDYEFTGASKGTIHYSYGCECNACGLSMSFAGDKPLWTAT